MTNISTKKYQITRQFDRDYFTIEKDGELLEDQFGNALRFQTLEEAQEAIDELLS